ncbi:hypothetical protein D1007_30610 [Hordeum vulgare]|nr:hypothetical protein D1007_30610 [Hordeum vulgare]
MAPRNLAPSLFAISCTKRRRVAAALKDSAWLHDLSLGFCDDMLDELIALSSRLEHISLQHDAKDCITWKLTSNGTYPTRSAFRMLFARQVRSQFPEFIWKAKAPLRCKFFVWTAVQHRVLTTDVGIYGLLDEASVFQPISLVRRSGNY